MRKMNRIFYTKTLTINNKKYVKFYNTISSVESCFYSLKKLKIADKMRYIF